MKLYDNLIEMRTLFSQKSGTVHYFRTFTLFLEIDFYLYEMRAVEFVEWDFYKRCSMAPCRVEI